MLAKSENALLKALREHRDIRQLVRTVGTLPQVIDAKLLAQYQADAPALYVVPGVFTVRDDAMLPSFTVAAVVRNVGGQEQARKGDGVDLGVDHLLTLAARALHGRRLGDCSWNLTRGQMVDEVAFASAGLSALEMVFEGSPIELTADYGFDELQDLLQVHADIDIAPKAGADVHKQWIREPADHSAGSPDATINVQLPGTN